MEKLQNYSVYTKRMEASLQEKLYFLGSLSPDVKYILDFGCANGVLLEAVSRTGYTCFGIDNDEYMRKLTQARMNTTEKCIYKSIGEFLKFNREKVGQTAIILSSVMHEVFHYNSEDDALDIIKEIFTAGFKQICIRDMALNSDLYISSPKPLLEVEKIKNHYLYDSYINHLGHEIKSYADLYHFLLKYRYAENWDRELNENYIMHPMEKLLGIFKRYMGVNNYSINYFEHKVLEYTQNKVYEDFGILMNKAVNYKIIYELY